MADSAETENDRSAADALGDRVDGVYVYRCLSCGTQMRLTTGPYGLVNRIDELETKRDEAHALLRRVVRWSEDGIAESFEAALTDIRAYLDDLEEEG